MVAAYNEIDAADNASKLLKEAMGKGEIKCHNIATIKKPEHGKLKITEAGKITKMYGAAVGAFVAGTSVLLLGPVAMAAGAVGGALAGATAAAGARTGAAYGAALAAQGTMLAQLGSMSGGALAGGYAASKIETLDHDKLKELGNVLKPNNSAILAVFDQVVVPMEYLGTETKLSRDDVLYKIGREIGETLEKGDDYACMVALIDDDGSGVKEFVATRAVIGDAAADIKKLVVMGEETVADDGDEPVDEDTITYEVIDGEVVDDVKKGKPDEK